MSLINLLDTITQNSLVIGVIGALVGGVCSIYSASYQTKRQMKLQKLVEQAKQKELLTRYCKLLRYEIITGIKQTIQISRSNESSKGLTIINADNYSKFVEVFELLSFDEMIALHELYSLLGTLRSWINRMGDTREIVRSKGLAEGICKQIFEGDFELLNKMKEIKTGDILENLKPTYQSLLEKLNNVQ
ncbi:hypothetical protein [Paenibacillus amylolyticus]|uniref:hypothetical protein n=1 Tax=Paenibacillus amylolyticus TaxID=1451 RepID=UPI00142899C3|nr:hypothetical protein [Paenibacillus amylolyticus]